MKKNNIFKRILSLVLSFSLALSLFGDLSLSAPLFADEVNYSKSPKMHIMVGYWGDDNVTSECYLGYTKEKKIVAYRDEGGNNSIDDVADVFATGSALDDATDSIAITIKDIAGYEFSGFAISAGYEAVDVSDDPENPVFTIKYTEDVHLVKIHVFYTEDINLVEGLDMKEGIGLDVGREQDTALYLKATKVDGDTITVDYERLEDISGIETSLDDDGQFVYTIKKEAMEDEDEPYSAFAAAHDSADWDITVVKRYDNSVGLHTDKTVTAAEDDPEGSRKFDVTLESWFSGNAIADVGLILDASGSMAFISDGLVPYKPSMKAIDIPGIEDEDKKLEALTNVLLTPEQVNKILYTNLTDNSKLGYSDYTYFVFDRRKDTREFVPLGYWGGYTGDSERLSEEVTPGEENPLQKGLVGHWDFDNSSNRYLNSASEETIAANASAKMMSHPTDDGLYTEASGKDISVTGKSTDSTYGSVPDDDKRNFQLVDNSSSDGRNSGLLLDVDVSDSFTLAFGIRSKGSPVVENKDKTQSPAPIVSIGGKNGYQIVRAGKSSTKRLKFGDCTDDNSPTAINFNGIFDDKNNTYSYITITVNKNDDGTITAHGYVNGTDTGENLDTGSNSNNGTLRHHLTDDNRQIVFGGYWDNAYKGNEILIDEIYLYDRALSADEVEKLFNLVSTGQPNVKPGTPEGVFVALSKKDGTKEDILATMDKVLEGKENLAGWYYVNSSSDWENHYGDETVATGKDYRYAVGNDVVENRILISDLPTSAQAQILRDLGNGIDPSLTGQDLQNAIDEAFKKSNYTLQEKFDKKANGLSDGTGNPAYIYTGSNDFTSKNTKRLIIDTFGDEKQTKEVKIYSKEDLLAAYPDSGGTDSYKQAAKDNIYPVAITLPETTRKHFTANGNENSSPLLFFIDGMGYLRCVFSNNNSVTKDGSDTEQKLEVSYVYVKDDSTRIKAEELQYALGTFNSELEQASPNSRVSAVRFSTEKMANLGGQNGHEIQDEDSGERLDNLVLLDWTKNAKEATQMLSVQRGDGSSLGSEKQEIIKGSGTDLGDEMKDGKENIDVYNYGLTGGTNTLLGFMAYQYKLDTLDDKSRAVRADKTREEGKKKYLIIFTDGKDSNVQKLEEENSKKVPNEKNIADYQANINLTYEKAKMFRDNGYTIFFVLLTGGAFSVDDRVKEFIANIAGDKDLDKLRDTALAPVTNPGDEVEVAARTDRVDKYYNSIALTLSDSSDKAANGEFVFEASTGEQLNSAFSDYILGAVSDALRDYTVQDYIDPRFDFVDDADNKYVLKQPAADNIPNIEVVSSDGESKHATLKTIDGITGQFCKVKVDGETALLGYDSVKSMYFIRWIDQDIPGCTTSDPDIPIWKSKITLEAKEDFIGGNAVLTNGNAADENYVMAEKDEEKSSGVSHSIRPTENDDADVSKGFPRTAANVRLYEPKMGKPEQTIYLGETITPEDIINALGKSMSTPPEPTEDDRPEDIAKAKKDYAHSGLYWDYIERYCKFAPGGGTTAEEKYKGYITNLINGARTSEGHTASFTLPYQYIPDPKDTSVFTGDDAHQNDVLGRITYTLTSTPLDGKETPKTGEDYITFVTKDRVYTLSVKFEAANITADTAAGDTKVELESRQSLNGGLTNEKEEMEGEGNVTRYVWKPTNKPAAGAEQSKKETTGSKTYKIVEGEINFGLVMSQDDYNYITTHFNNPGKIGYTASLSREYPAAAAAAISEASDSSEAMGTYHPTLSFTKVEESKPKTDGTYYFSYLPLELSEGAKAKYGGYYLPIGKYALTGSSDETTLPITFETIEDVAVDTVNSDLIFYRSQKDIDDKISATKFSTYAAAYSDRAFLLGGDGKSEGYTNQRLGLARIRATVDKANLTVTKVLTGVTDETKDEEFTFTLSNIKYGGEELADDTFMCQKGSDDPVSVKLEGYTFTLKSGESITFKDLPVGLSYTITESSKDGYTQVSATNYDGKISEGGVTATFTNIKNTPVTAPISASKTMTGDRTDLNATLDIYEFTLTAKDGAPMPEGSTSAGCKVTNNPDGSISFGEISYDTPGTYQYTIEETSVGAKGVTVDTISYTVTVEVGYKNKNEGTLEVKDVTYSYEKDGKSGTATSAEFTNKYTYDPLTKSYSFNISKTLTGPIDLNSEISKVFTFTVERTSAPESIRDHIVPDFVKQEIEVTVSGSDESYSGRTSADQVINDTYNVPGTYKYEIKEVVPDPEPDGMIYSGATYTLTVVVKDNNEGNLEVTSATWSGFKGTDVAAEGSTPELTFENKYVPASVDIPISKTLKGGDTFDSAVTFTFNAELTSFSGNMDDLGADVKSSSATVNVLSKAESGSDKFTIGQFTKAGTYTYTVTETQSIDPALPTGGQMDYSEKEYTVIVTVTDEAEGLKAVITEKSEKTAGKYTGSSLEFTNKYTAPGSLTISKTLTRPATSENTGKVDFEFIVTLTPPHGVTLSGQYGGATFTDDDKDGTYTGTVTVSSGDSVTLKGLPAGTSYTVTENSKPGYTQTGKSGDSGEIAAKATKEATFTNVENTPVTAIISASKKMAGDRTELNATLDIYSFILKAIDGAPMPEGSTPAGCTVTNTSDGSISFGKISYDTPGTYRYTIEETPVNEKGVTSDTASYTVTVKVEGDKGSPGTLTVSVEYVNDSEPGVTVDKESVVFTNTYKHEQVSGDYSFNISKTLTGPVDNISNFNKEFNFKVTRTYVDNTSSGSHIPNSFDDMTVTFEAANKDASGNYTGEIPGTISDTYTAPGTYTYTITEVVPEPAQNGLAYSKATYTLTVVVVDDNVG